MARPRPDIQIPSASRHISFHQLLVAARKQWLFDALSEAVGGIDPNELGVDGHRALRGRLRLMEYCRLRVKGLDFSQNQIVVRSGKGEKDRVTMLPGAIKDLLLQHLCEVKRQHEEDLGEGLGRMSLPYALERKYPNAGKEWGWQWMFPASGHYTDRVTGEKRRHHLHESVIQKAVKEAQLKAGIAKPAGRTRSDIPSRPISGGRLRYSDCSGAAWAQ